MRQLIYSLLAVACILATSLHSNINAKEEGHVKNFEMGTYLMGAKVTPKELLGKVVVLEEWGLK